MKILLGVDSHDSPFAGCTTHFMVFLLKKLSKDYNFKVKLNGLPKLVRLNPYIPWKTRGNASVGAELVIEEEISLTELYERIDYYSRIYSTLTKGSSGASAVVVDYSEALKFKQNFISIYNKCLTDIIPLNIVFKKLDIIPACLFTPKRGAAGAAAAIGFILNKENRVTYELILYRRIENTCKERRVDEASIALAEERIKTLFNNYDYRRRKAIAVPRGPDPVLLGLRGLNPLDALKAINYIKINEIYNLMCLFETNQHTDAHAVERRISDLRVYETCLIKGIVCSKPKILKGGHVRIEVADSTGTATIMVYRPTHPLSVIASRLHPGDEIKIIGGVVPSSEYGFVINTEKIIVDRIAPEIIVLNPRCPRCGSRMKSAGSKGGFKCVKCGYRVKGLIEKEYVYLKRNIQPGEYIPPPGRYTHLTKPPGINPLKAPEEVEEKALSIVIKKLFST